MLLLLSLACINNSCFYKVIIVSNMVNGYVVNAIIQCGLRAPVMRLPARVQTLSGLLPHNNMNKLALMRPEINLKLGHIS